MDVKGVNMIMAHNLTDNSVVNTNSNIIELRNSLKLFTLTIKTKWSNKIMSSQINNCHECMGELYNIASRLVEDNSKRTRTTIIQRDICTKELPALAIFIITHS